MGRKIPGKKHRGVKDPAIQRLNRLESIKTKINAPPKDPNEQHIPKSLLKIMDLTQKVKNGTISLKYKKKKKKNTKEISSAPKNIKRTVKRLVKRNEKPIPVFTQKSGENDQKFMNRVRIKIDDFINEQKFEEKFGVDIKRNIVTGKITEITKKTKEKMVDPVKKRTDKTLIVQDNVSSENTMPKLTKNQKRQQKIKLKKINTDLKKVNEFKEYKDEVKFGEVVHAPPVLIKLKKSLGKTSKPGQKDLLLKSFINQNVNSSIIAKNVSNVKNIKKNLLDNKISINKKGKRKKLPIATRQQLEMHQKSAVKAYKEMKNKRVNQIKI